MIFMKSPRWAPPLNVSGIELNTSDGSESDPRGRHSKSPLDGCRVCPQNLQLKSPWR